MKNRGMMRRAFISAVWIVCACLMAGAAARGGKSLEIYFIDVEGGQSTLVVDPQGESLLIDAGWDDFNGRDANRIVSAAKAAGIDRIDWLVVTHYHADHAGGVPQLAGRMKIMNFADHAGELCGVRKGGGTSEPCGGQAGRYDSVQGHGCPSAYFRGR